MLLKADNTLINILVSSNQKENNKDNISEPQLITNTLFCNNFPCLITIFIVLPNHFCPLFAI